MNITLAGRTLRSLRCLLGGTTRLPITCGNCTCECVGGGGVRVCVCESVCVCVCVCVCVLFHSQYCSHCSHVCRSYGGWVAPNIYYLGNAGVVQFGGLRIAGLSGIYKSNDYRKSK